MKSHIAPCLPAGRYRISHIAKDLFLCLLSAVLLILSFPSSNLWLFAWFGFLPLFFVLKNKTRFQAFLLAYLSGVIFWVGIIYWLVHVTLLGTILLILYLALYFGIFGLIIQAIGNRVSNIKLLFIPCVWVILEYIRGHLFTGFPWALLGYSQYLNLPIIQIADLTGAWGVSFLIMMANVAIHSFFTNRKKYLLGLLCIIIVLIYGYYKIASKIETARYTNLKVSVIQPNIPQELKWDPNARGYILARYARLTEEAAYEKPALIIWPEAATPGLLGEDKQGFQEIFSLGKKIKIPLLIGSVASDHEKYFNSALLINSSGKILARYDKLHLVPFGEYIPLKKFLPFLETVVPIGDITPGRDYTVFKLPTQFSVLICFEDLFPQISREFVKKGALFLVNITNDAWYKATSAPFQHLQASVFRAVENRINLVRSANTGVSGFIAPNGKIISLVQDKTAREIFIDGYKTQEFTISRGNLTFYTRYGDIFVVFCFLVMLYVIISPFKKKR